jgi:hypothetical protein
MDCSWATLKCELIAKSVRKPEIDGDMLITNYRRVMFTTIEPKMEFAR